MSTILTFFVEGALAWKSGRLHSVDMWEDAPLQQPQATGAVLDTQDRKDCEAVILLNTAQYSEHLTPASDTNRNSMKRWLNEQSFRSGGTDFKIAVDAGSTSMCQKALISLTDGTTAMSKNHNMPWAQETTKRLSCENRGIVCTVPDGSDLSLMLARYREYFGAGDLPAFVN